MFKVRFSANKVDLSRLHDLFDVKQREGELLKEYLNHLCAVFVRFQTPNEEMVVAAFHTFRYFEPLEIVFYHVFEYMSISGCWWIYVSIWIYSGVEEKVFNIFRYAKKEKS